MKYEKAWCAALKQERGIDAEQLVQAIKDAWDNRRIPHEAVQHAEDALRDSYRAFAENGGKCDVAMLHGQVAFERCNRLHTLQVLDSPTHDGRVVQAARPKGARKLAEYNDKRKAETIKRGDALWQRYCMLTATGQRDRAEAVTTMADEKRWGSRATVQRVVKE
jgi:hypothetical protein